MSLSAAERETVYCYDDESKTWAVSTFVGKHITRLKKNSDLVIIEEGIFEGTPFLRGELPAGGVNSKIMSTGSRASATPKTKKKVASKRGMPASAARCLDTRTKSGKPCQSLASKLTGKCSKHG